LIEDVEIDELASIHQIACVYDRLYVVFFDMWKEHTIKELHKIIEEKL
jgi:hypothetical protein